MSIEAVKILRLKIDMVLFNHPKSVLKFLFEAKDVLDKVIAEAEQDKPVAVVTGMYGGRFIVEPTNSAMVLPVNMALYTHPQPRKPVKFPTMIRRMWSGGEVQAWLDENVNKE